MDLPKNLQELTSLLFLLTMLGKVHYGLIKFSEQEQKVPEGANRYWLKRIAPPLEFGSMHAICKSMTVRT